MPERLTCPSSVCAPGHHIIGIVRPDGSVAGVWPPVEVDAAFARRAGAGGRRPPETRFRFAGPCTQDTCGHWTQDQRCRLGDAVARVVPQHEGAGDAPSAPGRLPICAIRARCRWWHQAGPAACTSCALVVHTAPWGPPDPAAAG